MDGWEESMCLVLLSTTTSYVVFVAYVRAAHLIVHLIVHLFLHLIVYLILHLIVHLLVG